MTNIVISIIQIASVLAASGVHEFAHAIVADKLGDTTPRNNGRVTLNPLAHIDPIGAISLWLFNFGWSKPVPINPRNFDNPTLGTALVSLAGPASNILAATSTSLLIKGVPGLAAYLFPFIFINCALALFNLIPIAPLDGFKIVSALLPLNLRLKWEELDKYGPILLILLIIPYSPIYSLFTVYMQEGLNLFVKLILF